ncbi:MAG: Rne/Rng family ribonuclease [Bacteroidales bacterium]|nr:Rne/Rng family ribonuclease [Bacteroidales bacterium]
MSTELIIDVTSSEISIALLKDKQLSELNREKRDIKFAVGDIFLAKVKKIMPGLNAAFVNVGYEKDAFLHYLDLGQQFLTLEKYVKNSIGRKGKMSMLQKTRLEKDIDKDGKISDVLKSGSIVLTQIVKEPISTKGPRLSSEISIAGRNLVLIPFANKVSISQKIKSLDEKKRLKKLVESIKPKNYGVIVRTVAEDMRVAVLDKELKGLVKRWEGAFNRIKLGKTPSLVLSELDRTSAILRDILNGSFNNIFINDENVYREIKEYIGIIAPEKEKIVNLYDGEKSIFEHFGIERQIKSLFGKTISFKNGAYLIIEHTEAFHVVDVNSGNRSKLGKDQESNAFEVNLAAADELARQLRLREMGGIIVVDFIDMNSAEHRNLLFERMKEAMTDDRTKHNILPLSRFGLMQITRQRVRPELKIQTEEKCPVCKGTGEVGASIMFVDKIETHIKFLVSQLKYKKLTLKVHPYVSAYLNKGFFSIKKKWKKKYNCKIKVQELASYTFLEYRFFDDDGEQIKN